MTDFWNQAVGQNPLGCCAIYGIYCFPFDNEGAFKRKLRAEMARHEREAARQNRSILLVSLNSRQAKIRDYLVKLGYQATQEFVRPNRSAITVCLLYKQVGV